MSSCLSGSGEDVTVPLPARGGPLREATLALSAHKTAVFLDRQSFCGLDWETRRFITKRTAGGSVCVCRGAGGLCGKVPLRL